VINDKIMTQLGGASAREGEDLVSVVIPCYKLAHFLGETIESVLRQSYPHREIIVVDDGSPDNTAEVSARYPEVRYIRQENQGGSRGAQHRSARRSWQLCGLY
jgi:glycosyltransferase involved in cell wall biosynthesis